MFVLFFSGVDDMGCCGEVNSIIFKSINPIKDLLLNWIGLIAHQ